MQTTLKSLTDVHARTEQLGAAMYELFANHGEATQTMLLREGFSLYELTTLGPAATQIAEQRRIRISEGFTRSDDEWVEVAMSAAPDLIDHQLIFDRLRHAGIPTGVLGRIWDKLLFRLAKSLAGRPYPATRAA